MLNTWCALVCFSLPSNHTSKKKQRKANGKLDIPAQMYPSEREKGDTSAKPSVSCACMWLFGEDLGGVSLLTVHVGFGPQT